MKTITLKDECTFTQLSTLISQLENDELKTKNGCIVKLDNYTIKHINEDGYELILTPSQAMSQTYIIKTNQTLFEHLSNDNYSHVLARHIGSGNLVICVGIKGSSICTSDNNTFDLASLEPISTLTYDFKD